MAVSVNLGALLRHYANRQESAFVNFKDFWDFLKHYAQHHLEESPSLVQYLEIPEAMLFKEIEELAAKHEVHILNHSPSKITVIVLTYYSVYFANRYKEMLSNPTIPFPSITDLPKQVPDNALEKKDGGDFIPQLYASQSLKSPKLYCIILPKDIPSILLPECVPVNFLIRSALAKIRHMLKKEEYHDYFLKKLRISNPNKEIGARGFFNHFVQSPDNVDMTFNTDTEAFYFWNQLCYFIRQDFEKVKDRTSEDTNILQALSVAEIYMMSLKEKASQEQKKQLAFDELGANLAKPPYFFSMDSIVKFRDSKGAMLYGQYTEEELKAELTKLTTESENADLPKLLVFKIESGARYFIYKAKVLPLVVRLANEAHSNIDKILTDKWYNTLLNYEKLPEMKDNKAFEIELHKQIQELSPVLYALLNANFLSVVNYEMNNTPEGNAFNIFNGTKLNSYSDILMLSNSSILSRAKMMLPFWYTIPIISFFASLFHKKTAPVVKSKIKSAELTLDEIPDEPKKTTGKIGSKKEVLAQHAKEISEELIPNGSSIDRELDSYHSIWNKMITKEARYQLTEDVNALIRDYMRKVVKTLSGSTFTLERVQSLAQALVKTPNMQKIKEEESLYMYVQLYILKLVMNG